MFIEKLGDQGGEPKPRHFVSVLLRENSKTDNQCKAKQNWGSLANERERIENNNRCNFSIFT